MNFKIVQQIMTHPYIRDTYDLAVLLVLAYHADEKGECWPSMAVIAHEARVSDESAARKIVRRIHKANYFSLARRQGRGNRNVYTLHVTKGEPITKGLKGGPRNPVLTTQVTGDGFRNAVLKTEKEGPETGFLNATQISSAVKVEENNTYHHVCADNLTNEDEVFTVFKNDDPIAKDNQTNTLETVGPVTLACDLAQRLIEEGVTTNTAHQLAHDFPDRIGPQLAYLNARKPRNRAATVVKAIRQDWTPPASYQPAMQSVTISAPTLSKNEIKQRDIVKRIAVEYDQTEGAERDAEFAALGSYEQQEIDLECKVRLQLLPSFLQTPQALVRMRRTLLRERKSVG